MLQYLDFSDLDVAGQVESLCLRGLLTDEQAAAVDREALERFLRSPLAEEIRRGQNVRRGVSLHPVDGCPGLRPGRRGGGDHFAPGRGGLLL
ncbi:MAG: hypothetical protein V8R40_09770 [Dysosmobacter sp.]